ncbi:MAG: M6 family metalloprotease domain-containing protein [Bacteroidales bacterium]|nr:M6 family metalloprotease domain-containing protein [Bacteroidales bacterium]
MKYIQYLQRIHAEILLLFLFFLITNGAHAARGERESEKFRQPDSTILTVYWEENGPRHALYTEDGYRIIRNADGGFGYAIQKEQTIVASAQLAHDKTQRSPQEWRFLLNSSVVLRSSFPLLNWQTRSLAMDDAAQSTSFPTKGKVKTLVILVSFSDLPFSVTDPNYAFSRSLNEAGYSDNGATGSVRDYYFENSSGQFEPDFDVIGPVVLSGTSAYYGRDSADFDYHAPNMVWEACQQADTLFDTDFTQYDQNGDGALDNVFVIYAGYDQAQFPSSSDLVWSHKYSLSGKVAIDGKKIYTYACTSELRKNNGTNPASIGTFCHEFGHVIGLPDFYKTIGNGIAVMKNYFLMDSGNYNNDGNTPPYLSAIERMLMGWMTPQVISNEPVTYSLPSIRENKAFQIPTSTPGEYFLLETRAPLKWDNTSQVEALGYGLLIYHVDRSASYLSRWENDPGTVNNDDAHRCCYALKATLSKWAFQQETLTSFSDDTEPSALDWNDEATETPLTNISLINNVVTFDVSGGGPVGVGASSLAVTPQVVISEGVIQVNGLEGDEWVSLYTPDGRILEQTRATSSCLTLSRQRAGLYLLKITGKENSWSKVIGLN